MDPEMRALYLSDAHGWHRFGDVRVLGDKICHGRVLTRHLISGEIRPQAVNVTRKVRGICLVADTFPMVPILSRARSKCE